MSLKFTQEEVEQELSDNLKHGRRHAVAQISGLGESYIKRQFNPDDETKSCAFTLLQIACALDELNEAEGDEFWRSICKFRELSKTRSKAAGSSQCPTGKLNKEVTEFVNARLDGLPVDIQMKELLDVRDQIDAVEDGLIAEFGDRSSAVN